ncbi:MAG: diacylglycerol kinase family protein [Patescibacteria group bacterium]|nr:diacylglycerol kinase family protein [Patescibacteria group bacterium]
MPPLVAVIINLNAMLIRRKGFKYINKIRSIAANFENVQVYITQSPRQVRNIIRRLKEMKVGYICCCGGDGALRHIIQETIKVYKTQALPVIAHIGGGSMSMIAKALGFKKEPHENLATVLKLRSQPSQPVYQKELIQIDDAGKIYYGFIFSIGVVVDCLKYYEKTSKGFWAAICLIFHCILGTAIRRLKIYHYAQAKVFYDDHQFPMTKFAGILASNVKDIVLTFKPFSGTIQPESFLLGIYALNAYELLSHVFRYLWGKPVQRDLKAGKVFNGNAQTLILETDEDLTIDGDVFLNKKKKMRTIKIAVGPTIPMLNLCPNSTGI